MNEQRQVGPERARFIPAAGYDWLTSAYDLLIRLTMPEHTFKRRLIEQAGIEAGHRVLDLGCGTATLTLMIKRAHPAAEVIGLDGDPRILKIARAKAQEAGLAVSFNEAMAFDLPYPDGSFDQALSSLVFHHLTRENKVRTLEEVLRVLRPGGELHVADWGKPHNAIMRVASLLVQTLDGHSTTSDNVRGLLPDLFRSAGFEEVQQAGHFGTVFGTLALYRARKPRNPNRPGAPGNEIPAIGKEKKQ